MWISLLTLDMCIACIPSLLTHFLFDLWGVFLLCCWGLECGCTSWLVGASLVTPWSTWHLAPHCTSSFVHSFPLYLWAHTTTHVKSSLLLCKQCIVMVKNLRVLQAYGFASLNKVLSEPIFYLKHMSDSDLHF